jgi:hypothetical protein
MRDCDNACTSHQGVQIHNEDLEMRTNTSGSCVRIESRALMPELVPIVWFWMWVRMMNEG